MPGNTNGALGDVIELVTTFRHQDRPAPPPAGRTRRRMLALRDLRRIDETLAELA